MYRVLIPIDASEERAASQARAVTRLPNAGEEVIAVLFHVFDDAGTAGSEAVTDLPPGERACELLDEEDVTVETERATGDIVQQIVDAADRSNADAVVMGGRKRSAVGSLLFGSVSQAVTLGTEVPVTITGDQVSGKPSYVCSTCGERYYTESEIRQCNECGGIKIEQPA